MRFEDAWLEKMSRFYEVDQEMHFSVQNIITHGLFFVFSKDKLENTIFLYQIENTPENRKIAFFYPLLGAATAQQSYSKIG